MRREIFKREKNEEKKKILISYLSQTKNQMNRTIYIIITD